MKKIAVAGTGYVGMSLAVLLAQRHQVVAFDVNPIRVEEVNQRRSPIKDALIDSYMQTRSLNLRATLDAAQAFKGADFVVICTPTDYDPKTNRFDTQSIEVVARQAIALSPHSTLVIKSTVPVGYTEKLKTELGHAHIVFSPEFLREGMALHDNLHPSRIVVGERAERGTIFAGLLREGALDTEVPVLLTNNSEAEAIKLFANTYLALRVAFFNELDTYAAVHGLDTRQVIDGVGLDARIGRHYNNPSFGYGGYCLPKDTRQLLGSCEDVPQDLIRAVVDANCTRKDFIVREVLRRQPKVVGIHRVIMKAGSDNYRASSVVDVMERLKSKGVEVIVYEPLITAPEFMHSLVMRSLDEFKRRSDLILSNRMSPDLHDVAARVYTRDLFGGDS
ncbi:nucleotide sugar dehydrogenase [Ramlibacter rhizophilus]|uniref:UDP-glucose 6-dehydrogenase n=1 Tax=Ramlibacter rhizophilus TaxID=1781167 RepID=A0A4Z0BY72_9BURK|nr:nucleotide sugar dehydrogenase [Ramlibacter rhizophilus]TFZ04203.1 nucleotide sugar dehydrogenase [Ramlibacter rhizophilus]